MELQVTAVRQKKTFVIKADGDESLYDLHAKILAANRWSPEHSFSFFMSDKFWDDENEFAGNCFEEGTSKVRLKKFDLKPGNSFLYLYDYGDEHKFKITVLGES